MATSFTPAAIILIIVLKILLLVWCYYYIFKGAKAMTGNAEAEVSIELQRQPGRRDGARRQVGH